MNSWNCSSLCYIVFFLFRVFFISFRSFDIIKAIENLLCFQFSEDRSRNFPFAVFLRGLILKVTLDLKREHNIVKQSIQLSFFCFISWIYILEKWYFGSFRRWNRIDCFIVILTLLKKTDVSLANEGQWRKKQYVDSSCRPQVLRCLSKFENYV